MAEPLSVAGGVVSFIGLSGQVLQGIKFLHGFLGDVKDAPENVKTLHAELKLIRTILEEAERQDTDIGQCPSMLEALNYCKSWVDKLEDLIRTCEPGNGKKTARLWSQLGLALRAKKLTKYIDGLERAKLMLLQARANLSSSTTLQHLTVTQDVQRSLSQLASNQESSAAVLVQAKDIIHLIRDDIETLSASQSAVLEQILMQMQVANRAQPIKIAEVSKNSLCQLSAKKEFHAPAGENRVLQLRQLSSTVTVSPAWVRTTKTYNLGVGYITITTSSQRHWQVQGSCELQSSDIQEAEVSFVPASWLLRCGVAFTLRKLPHDLLRPNIQLSLRPFTIIGDDNPIIEAMRSGSLRRVRALIADGKAHPHSLLSDGKTLFHKCLWEMYVEANPWDELHHSEFTVGDNGIYGKPLAEEVVESLTNMLEIARWLLKQGVDPGCQDVYHRTAFDEQKEIVDCDDVMFPSGPNGLAFYRNMIDLGTAMFGAAKTNPLFRRNAEQCSITEKGEDLLTLCTWVPISENIAGSQQADGGALMCLTMLEALFECPPYAPRRSRAYANPDWRPPLTLSLIRTARAGKLWLSGDKEEEAECFRLAFCVIRGALVQTSPYCRFHVAINVHGKGPFSIYPGSEKGEDAVRDMMCGEIAALLGYDPQVASMTVDGESLTTLADKWAVLDIWREALSRAGFEADTVVGSELWMSRCHLYGPLSSILSDGGASVHLSANSSSGQVCLIVGNSPESKLPSQQDPIGEQLAQLGSDWFTLSGVHCEITALPVAADTGSPTGKFELFIDCQELGEQWNQRVAEVQSRTKETTSKSEESDVSCETISPEIGKPDVKEGPSVVIPPLVSVRFIGLTISIILVLMLGLDTLREALRNLVDVRI